MIVLGQAAASGWALLVPSAGISNPSIIVSLSGPAEARRRIAVRKILSTVGIRSTSRHADSLGGVFKIYSFANIVLSTARRRSLWVASRKTDSHIVALFVLTNHETHATLGTGVLIVT